MIDGVFAVAILAGVGLVMLVLLVLVLRQRRDLARLEEKLGADGSVNLLAEWLRTLDSNLRQQTETVNRTLQRTNQVISQRLDAAAQLISSVGKEVGQVRQIGQQLSSFQEMLRAPKFRGNLGEEILRDLIAQVLPREVYDFQYRFRNGLIVDAVVRTESGLIPIDSKFPLEAFQRYARAEGEREKESAWREFRRSFKQHVEAVATKYILPAEGTTPFALLYVPSEAVYHEIVSRGTELIQYAREKAVFLVSPNGFYYFLQVLLVGLQGQRVEEAAKQILETLAAIRRENEQLGEALRTLESHLNNARGALDRVRNRQQSFARLLESAGHLSPASVVSGGKSDRPVRAHGAFEVSDPAKR